MENGSNVLNLSSAPHGEDLPPPQLLLQLEPGYRIFFRNLGYTILGQPLPRVAITSAPADYWSDIFINAWTPWWALLESALWHMVAIVLLIALSGSVGRHPIQVQRITRTGYITYYPPMQTFPASGSRRPSPQAQTKALHKSAEPQPMHVARQAPNDSHTLVAPPDIAELTKRPKLPNADLSAAPAPAAPLAATVASQLRGLPGPAEVIGPAPQVQRAASWREGAMQVSVVAPQPEVKIASSRRGVGGAGRVEVVAPAPQLPMHNPRGGSGAAQDGLGAMGGMVVPPQPAVKRANGFGLEQGQAGLGGGSGLMAVPPAPSLNAASGTTGRGGMGLPGSSGLAAVPPAPSVEGAGAATARGGMGLLGGKGLSVVPPAPGLTDEGLAASHGRRAGLGLGSGTGTKIVPPAPSVAGAGMGRGRGSGGARLGVGGGDGLAAVPPAPAIDGGPGDGGSGSHGRSGVGFGGGSELAAVPPAPSVGGPGSGNGRGMGSGGGLDIAAVPPAPSVTGTGGGGNGRGPGGLGGSGLDAVPPAPAMEGGTGSSGRGGDLLADSNPSVVPPPPSAGDADQAATDSGLKTVVEELHMRIVGLAFAMPSTSFASSYEVFIAERQLPSHGVQLIKLVYWFLPYQERLSDYHPDYTKMYKLRATRDAACDESLVHMTVSATGQAYSSAQLSTLSPGFPSGNRDITLPCYRTTAEDYRKALSRGR